MAFMEWQESFALGIDTFDEHHRHLIDLINRTYEEITNGAPAHNLEQVILDLSDYATYHFALEERWMKQHGYPDLPQHQKEHLAFLNKIIELRAAFNIGEANVSHTLLQFLLMWLTRHILDSDAGYGRFAQKIA